MRKAASAPRFFVRRPFIRETKVGGKRPKINFPYLGLEERHWVNGLV